MKVLFSDYRPSLSVIRHLFFEISIFSCKRTSPIWRVKAMIHYTMIHAIITFQIKWSFTLSGYRWIRKDISYNCFYSFIHKSYPLLLVPNVSSQASRLEKIQGIQCDYAAACFSTQWNKAFSAWLTWKARWWSCFIRMNHLPDSTSALISSRDKRR